jgi:hypothetical protein
MAHDDMSPEERMDALARELAEGFLFLADRGLLDFDEERVPATPAANQKPVGMTLISGGNEGTPS